jgi:RimJ/RimL family protein N-acetyltransferase
VQVFEEISLQPYTQKLCQSFYRDYISDPQMTHQDFVYDTKWVQRYYEKKVQEKDRAFFAICRGKDIIGECQLKHIDLATLSATMSIHLQQDRYKNQGYGTKAIILLCSYAGQNMGLKTLYADAVLRNLRSQHVLEKCGFTRVKQDENLVYYMKPLV